MGVAASMSISLLRDGRLWGLIACHHYSGPHDPPFGVRAAAEFLGSSPVAAPGGTRRGGAPRRAPCAAGTLSRCCRPAADHRPRAGRRPSLPGTSGARPRPRAGRDRVRRRRSDSVGAVPADPDGRVLAGAGRAGRRGGRPRLRCRAASPALAAPGPAFAGLLGAAAAGRPVPCVVPAEPVHNVDWGGDPHNKAIAEPRGRRVRLSPRKSFERWRETVRGRAASPGPSRGASAERAARAACSRRSTARARSTVRAARDPAAQPAARVAARIEGWRWTRATCPPRAAGRRRLVRRARAPRRPARAGRSATSPGTGSRRRGAMGEMRNALRAYLLDADSPAGVLGRLNRMVRRVLPRTFATCLVAMLDPGRARARVASCGHPPLALVSPDGAVELADVALRAAAGRDLRARAPARTRASRSRPAARSSSTPTGSSSAATRSSTAGSRGCVAAAGRRAARRALRRARRGVPRPRGARRRDRLSSAG